MDEYTKPLMLAATGTCLSEVTGDVGRPRYQFFGNYYYYYFSSWSFFLSGKRQNSVPVPINTNNTVLSGGPSVRRSVGDVRMGASHVTSRR